MEDVVRSGSEFFDHCGLFEVFQRLVSDLGMNEGNRNTFNNRVVALRKQMRGDTQNSEISSSAHRLQTCQGVNLQNKIEASDTHVACSSTAESSAAEDFDSFWSEVLSVLAPESDLPVEGENFIESEDSSHETAGKRRKLY